MAQQDKKKPGQKKKGGFGVADKPTDIAKMTSEITSRGSPMMEQAATTGKQFGAKRGLANSSMSARAAHTAALDKAVPMATQQAQLNQGSNQNALDRKWESSEAEADREWKSGETAADREFKASQAQADRDWKSGEAAADRKARRQEAKLERDTRLDLAEMDADLKRELGAIDVQQKDRDMARSMATEALKLHQNTVINTNNNKRMDGQQRSAVIAASRDNARATFDMINSMFSVDVSWPAANTLLEAGDEATVEGRGRSMSGWSSS